MVFSEESIQTVGLEVIPKLLPMLAGLGDAAVGFPHFLPHPASLLLEDFFGKLGIVCLQDRPKRIPSVKLDAPTYEVQGVNFCVLVEGESHEIFRVVRPPSTPRNHMMNLHL
jgi:hypothetical protein